MPFLSTKDRKQAFEKMQSCSINPPQVEYPFEYCFLFDRKDGRWFERESGIWIEDLFEVDK